jgi:c-di-GMP-binding flagellar brake protein YcgR
MKKAKTKKTISKKAAKKQFPAAGIEVNRRKEWRFELPLSTQIEGKLPHGLKFREETVLGNISSGGAYFCLDSGVIVGSKLNLVIVLPREVTEGQNVKLQLGGITVRLEEPNLKSKKQGVAVRFEKEFKFVSGKERKKK